MELTTLSLADQSRLIACREISPVELATAYLDRIASIEPTINSFITVTADEAMAAAREAERDIVRGDHRGVLHGIPIAVKDLFDTRGTRTTAGSKFFATRIPDADAAVIELLKAAGAVVLGKLNMHEWALGVTSDNPHYGPVRNPLALDRVPGGSSGGSAAATAAGLCAASLGSDTGGSIRIPASLCGVVGLKPTRGRVSLRGAIPLSWNLDHAGPLARSVRDAALLFDALDAFDPADPVSERVRPRERALDELEGGVAGWRIAVLGAHSLAGAYEDVRDALGRAATVFETLGATVLEVELPQIPEAARLNGLMTTSDGAAYHHERMERAPHDFGADVLARLRRGASYGSREYAEARHAQDVLRRELESLFRADGGDYDLLITPTTPCAAPLRAGLDAVEAARLLTRFTAPFNFTGLPALSVPCGTTDNGLPLGLQLVGPRHDDASVLRAGRAYEEGRG